MHAKEEGTNMISQLTMTWCICEGKIGAVNKLFPFCQFGGPNHFWVNATCEYVKKSWCILTIGPPSADIHTQWIIM